MNTHTDIAMTPDEYKALRDKLGWSQQKLATVLGLTVSTISRRERGDVPIDAEAAHAIRSLADDTPPPEAA